MESKRLKKENVAKKKTFRIKFEYWPNEDMVEVHTRKKLPDYNSEFEEDKHNKRPIHNSLIRTKGIVCVSSYDGYQLGITKGKLFSWDELKPKIIRSIKKYLADGLEIEELSEGRPSEWMNPSNTGL
mgnify:CR=1 FL=1